MDISVISVIFGGILLSAVIFKYLQKDSNKQVALTSLLTVVGFALIASPAWTSISFKSSEIELELIGEATSQMEDYVKIIEGYNARSSTWRDIDETKIEQEQLALSQLARELASQTEKIERAKSLGNIDQAIIETQKGTEIISKIADRVSVR